MCSCGMSKKSGGTGTKWLVIYPDSTKKTYASETDARIAASQTPGSRVRPV
jgi:hypothetical protein